jgi:hypothetical protein
MKNLKNVNQENLFSWEINEYVINYIIQWLYWVFKNYENIS